MNGYKPDFVEEVLAFDPAFTTISYRYFFQIDSNILKRTGYDVIL